MVKFQGGRRGSFFVLDGLSGDDDDDEVFVSLYISLVASHVFSRCFFLFFFKEREKKREMDIDKIRKRERYSRSLGFARERGICRIVDR